MGGLKLPNGFVDVSSFDWDKLAPLQEKMEVISRSFIGEGDFVDFAKWKYSIGNKVKFYFGTEKCPAFGVVCLLDGSVVRGKKILVGFDHISYLAGECKNQMAGFSVLKRAFSDIKALKNDCIWVVSPSLLVERAYAKFGCKIFMIVLEMKAVFNRNFRFGRGVSVSLCSIGEYINDVFSLGQKRLYPSVELWQRRLGRPPVKMFYNACRVIYNGRFIGGILYREDYGNKAVYVIDWWLYHMKDGDFNEIQLLFEAICLLFDMDVFVVYIILPYSLKDIFMKIGFKIVSSHKLVSYPDRITDISFVSAVDMDFEEIIV